MLIEKDNILDCNLDLKDLDILFKKIESFPPFIFDIFFLKLFISLILYPFESKCSVYCFNSSRLTPSDKHSTRLEPPPDIRIRNWSSILADSMKLINLSPALILFSVGDG